jgi:hypothetical protein
MVVFKNTVESNRTLGGWVRSSWALLTLFTLLLSRLLGQLASLFLRLVCLELG